jgi:hypothetical protein
MVAELVVTLQTQQDQHLTVAPVAAEQGVTQLKLIQAVQVLKELLVVQVSLVQALHLQVVVAVDKLLLELQD